jgi:hypothetical protein
VQFHLGCVSAARGVLAVMAVFLLITYFWPDVSRFSDHFSLQTWDTRNLSSRCHSQSIMQPQLMTPSASPTPPIVTCLMWHQGMGELAVGCSDGRLCIGLGSGNKNLAGRVLGSAVSAMSRLVAAAGLSWYI